MRMRVQGKGWQSLAPPQQNLEARSGLSNLRRQPPSDPRVIAKINHSIGKTALVQEIQPYAYVARQDPRASANHSRHDEQMIVK